MDMTKNDVKVYYKHKDKIVTSWDLAIEDVLFAFGMKRWASGFDLTNGVRDLAFRKQTEKEFIERHG